MAYEYGAKEPEKLKIDDMTPREKELLLESDSFCMMPWLHLHAFPDGRAYPCCFGLDKYPVGNLNKDSMETVFNGPDMREMRRAVWEVCLGGNRCHVSSLKRQMVRNPACGFVCLGVFLCTRTLNLMGRGS